MFQNANMEDTILNRMTTALTYKVDQRCADLTVLFERGSRKDLQTFFPMLIDNIFGPQGTFSWGLRNIMQDYHHTEFTVLLNFLKPMGPVFKLIYSLLCDSSVKYDFSLAYLPMKVRQMLESSNIYPFYAEVLQFTTQTKQPISLLLNPFDYYIFHFTYHLINPCHQRNSNDEQWNTVYYNLCTEYILHFFPTNLESILPSVSFYRGKNPMQMSQAMHRSLKQSSLLKANIYSDSQVRDFSTMHQNMEKHPRNEIWRSETILMAFIDFWLSNDQVCLHYDTMNLSANSMHLELPSADYIRIIRMAVKHIHAFTSTASIDITSLGELRKITLPMIQSRMYIFLRNLLYRWPLDESFRLVLELWLSFIQPWRYCHDLYAQRGGNLRTPYLIPQIGRENIKSADETYLPFIAENLLNYVVIFQQLLPRFTRVDLSSPKNAQMLFRLTKVFNQPKLVQLIKNIESIVENRNYSPNHQFSSPFSASMPPLSPTTRWSSNTSAIIHDSTHIESPKKNMNFVKHDYDNIAGKYFSIVRQKIYEIEGPNFCYKPLFTAHAAAEVYELLRMVKSAEIKAITILNERRRQEEEATGFIAFFTKGPIMDQVSLLDRQKAPNFLKCAADNLIEIFGVEDFANFEVTPEMSRDISGNLTASPESQFPDMLTPEKVRKRMQELKYEGDPDLIPIRSYENKFLVRVLYDLSQKINENYGAQINRLYRTDGLLGRFARNFIKGPERIYTYKKHHGISERVPYDLPARISMRSFADHSFLLFLFIGCLITFYLGYGHLTFIFLYLFLYLALVFVKSLFQRDNSTLDLSFNDTLDE